MGRLLSDYFKNQLTTVGRLRRDAESVLDELGRVLEPFFAGVVKAAQNRSCIHFLTGLDLENYTDSRVDRIFFHIAPRADHRGSSSDILRVDSAHVAAPRRRDFPCAGRVRQKLEPVE